MAAGRIRERSNKRTGLNIGFVIFVFILGYILVSFLLSLRKPQPSIYEVQKISLATNNLARAVVVREEQNVVTDYSGYVSFYLKNGTRVAKNEAVFSVDDSRSLRDAQKDKLEVATRHTAPPFELAEFAPLLALDALLVGAAEGVTLLPRVEWSERYWSTNACASSTLPTRRPSLMLLTAVLDNSDTGMSVVSISVELLMPKSSPGTPW